MGTTTSKTNGRLRIRLLKDAQLVASNMVPINASEFEDRAYRFKAGTIFINYGAPADNPDEDPDCVENDGPHGWCYVTAIHNGSQVINYCNFHAWILNYWPERPDLFELVDN